MTLPPPLLLALTAIALTFTACGGSASRPGHDVGGGPADTDAACEQVPDGALRSTIREGAGLLAGDELTAADAARVEALFLEGVASLEGIDCLSGLRHLTIAGTSTVGSLGPLANVPSLRSLDISWTAVTDLAPLAGLALEELSAHDTGIGDLTPLAGSTSLKWLSLYRTSVTDLAPLSSVASLDTLQLNETPIRNVEPLANLTQLERLGIARTPIQNAAPLANLTRLRSLDLSSTAVDSLAPIGAPAQAGACLEALELPLRADTIAVDVPRLEGLGWRVAWSSATGDAGNPGACDGGRL